MFPGPNPMGFVWGGVGRALMQFMHFSAIFAVSAVLWYMASLRESICAMASLWENTCAIASLCENRWAMGSLWGTPRRQSMGKPTKKPLAACIHTFQSIHQTNH